MVRSFLIRGMLVGILAGLLVFAFAKVYGEPQVDTAIAFETHLDQLKGEPPEAELVSRQIQSTLGLLTGVVVYGAAIGGIFSLVCAYGYGRMGRLGPRAVAAVIAAVGFVVITVVPQIKYPANPPAIGNPETIGLRTGLYFGIIVISIIVLVAAINLGRALLPRLGRWNAILAGGGLYVVVTAIAIYVLPPINEVPEGFSAVVLWNFRLASLGMQVILWGTLGLVFGWLTERSTAPAKARAAAGLRAR